MDRGRLGRFGLELGDDDFARALAAIGAFVAGERIRENGAASGALKKALNDFKTAGVHARPEQFADLLSILRDQDGILDWTLPAFERLDPTIEPIRPNDLARGWRLFVDHASSPVRLRLDAPAGRFAEIADAARILGAPAVRTSSAFVAATFVAAATPTWDWPFHLATFPGDPLAAWFRLDDRPSWPYRFDLAGSDRPHHEIVVSSLSLRGTLARLLSGPGHRRASLAVVLGGADRWDAAEPLLAGLAGELEAAGIVVVEPASQREPREAVGRVRGFADELTHARWLDEAINIAWGARATAFLDPSLIGESHITRAVGDIVTRLRSLPPTAMIDAGEHTQRGLNVPTSLPPGGLADAIYLRRTQFSFKHESDAASLVTEISAHLASRETDVANERAVMRFIQHRILRAEGTKLVERHDVLRVGEPVLLKIRIGPAAAEWSSAEAAFPEHLLPKDRSTHQLQVVFYEPAQIDAPIVRDISLPAAGPSTETEIALTPRTPGAFVGRMTVLHRGRVLQTALLRARVVKPGEATLGEEIRQETETIVRASCVDLASRQRFDVAFVLNHDANERPMLTGVAGERAWATDLTGIQEPVRKANAALSEVALSLADHDEGLFFGENPKLFVRLAQIGAELHSRLCVDLLQQATAGGFDVDAQTHVQVISTRADAIVPFELIYDYDLPDDKAPKVCPQALAAIEAGRCPTPCDRTAAPGDYVCPMGFWGLRKVIERHVFNAKLGKPDQAEVIVQAEPIGSRRRLVLDKAAVVGFSAEVSDESARLVVEDLMKRLDERVKVATTWVEWRQAVENTKPTLLVAFPHNDSTDDPLTLEIHGDKLETLRLVKEKQFVRDGDDFPLVLLLGCDTASSAEEYSSHLRYFRQAGAAAIISTIATVFGTHAVQVGRSMLSHMLDNGTGPRCLGDALLQARRDALRASLPMALCVVAFGDADWQV